MECNQIQLNQSSYTSTYNPISGGQQNFYSAPQFTAQMNSQPQMQLGAGSF